MVNLVVLIFCLLVPVTPRGVTEKNTKQKQNSASQRIFSEQVRQDETRRLWFNTVDPEVGTAGVILVPSIGQLETVCF